MTTRDDLHRLVDQLPPEGFEALADVLRRLQSLTDHLPPEVVDQLPPEGLEALTEVLHRLQSLAGHLPPEVLEVLPDVLHRLQVGLLPVSAEPPYPRSVGILTGAPTDLSANLDNYLADGFGQ